MERGIRTYASVEDFVEDRLPGWAVLLGKGHFDRLKGEVGCVGVWCGWCGWSWALWCGSVWCGVSSPHTAPTRFAPPCLALHCASPARSDHILSHPASLHKFITSSHLISPHFISPHLTCLTSPHLPHFTCLTSPHHLTPLHLLCTCFPMHIIYSYRCASYVHLLQRDAKYSYASLIPHSHHTLPSASFL